MIKKNEYEFSTKHNLKKNFSRIRTEVQIINFTCLSSTNSLRTWYEGHDTWLPELWKEIWLKFYWCYHIYSGESLVAEWNLWYCETKRNRWSMPSSSKCAMSKNDIKLMIIILSLGFQVCIVVRKMPICLPFPKQLFNSLYFF